MNIQVYLKSQLNCVAIEPGAKHEKEEKQDDTEDQIKEEADNENDDIWDDLDSKK